MTGDRAFPGAPQGHGSCQLCAALLQRCLTPAHWQGVSREAVSQTSASGDSDPGCCHCSSTLHAFSLFLPGITKHFPSIHDFVILFLFLSFWETEAEKSHLCHAGLYLFYIPAALAVWLIPGRRRAAGCRAQAGSCS